MNYERDYYSLSIRNNKKIKVSVFAVMIQSTYEKKNPWQTYKTSLFFNSETLKLT